MIGSINKNDGLCNSKCPDDQHLGKEVYPHTASISGNLKIQQNAGSIETSGRDSKCYTVYPSQESRRAGAYNIKYFHKMNRTRTTNKMTIKMYSVQQYENSEEYHSIVFGN